MDEPASRIRKIRHFKVAGHLNTNRAGLTNEQTCSRRYGYGNRAAAQVQVKAK